MLGYRPRILWIVDSGDAAIDEDLPDDSDRIILNGEIFESAEIIGKKIRESGAEMLMLTRNDQIPPRARIGRLVNQLGTGYSSVSPIDSPSRSQLSSVIADFLRGGSIKVKGSLQKKSTDGNLGFSLFFDVEQMGGVKYGLPRILSILEDVGVQATFFVTNLMSDRYIDLVPTLIDLGHQIGIHGLYHETLSGLELERQVNLISMMKNDLGLKRNWMANLIGRMDYNTIEALARCGCTSFLLPRKHIATPLGFINHPSRPMPFSTPSGRIWGIPVSMETYGKPGFLTPKLFDFCVESSKKSGISHVCVLMHPFRDGNLRNIGATRNLITYMKKRGLGTPLENHTLGFRDDDDLKGVRILYRMPDYRSGFSPAPLGLLARSRLIYDLLISIAHEELTRSWVVDIGFEPNSEVPNILVGRHEGIEDVKIGNISKMHPGDLGALGRGMLRRLTPTISPRFLDAGLGLSLVQLLSVIEGKRSSF